MAVITPQTDVYLLKVPLEINDINQLTFSNSTTQYNYFFNLPKRQFDNFTYQRKDGVLRIPDYFDELLEYNYVMYRNEAYSNKWFYAFITGMEYKSNGTTDISIKTDVWQTWQFDLTYKPVLIDREHPNTDVAGDNTLPEGLELGEMVCNGSTTNFGGGNPDPVNKRYYTVIEVSQIENRGESGTISYRWISGSHDLTPSINEIERGTIPLIVGGTFAGSSSGIIRTPSDITHLFDTAGLGDSIVNVYILPSELVPAFNEVEITATPQESSIPVLTMDGIGIPIATISTINMGTTNFTKPSTVNGYSPKNKKLLTYPYCYFNISNNSGTVMPYRYEDFNGTISFGVEGTFGVSGSTKAIPQNYLNIGNGNAIDYSITGGKFPVCSWRSDSYTNWLTQNSVNLNTQWKTTILHGASEMASGALEAGIAGATLGTMAGGAGSVTGAIAGATAGAIGSAVGIPSSLINVAREQHLAKTQANMVSDQSKGNLGAGDFMWAKYRTPFTFMPMSIKAEYARCIDEFFSQFGYKCNRVKIPNITGRRNWNYVKTVGCYIEADIPQADLAEIKSMFDKGITLWHNASTFADYSQNNDII